MTEDTANLLMSITKTTRELEKFESDLDADEKFKTRAPAHEKDLLTLERHWGHRLPAAYRAALATHNGIRNFCPDFHLLSAKEIITDEYDAESFEETCPGKTRFIVACATDDVHAVFFDFAEEHGGDPSVVRVTEEGEVGRWPDFNAFLAEHLSTLAAELDREQADRASLRD